ncbi:MAG: YbaK/EbsC family protein [Anaerolineales bacterium]
MTIVNNVTRLLDSRKIPYTVFVLPPEKIGALETARLLDVEPATVYKTIVVTRDKPGKPLLVVIPGSHQVDLKSLAAFLGEKKVRLPTEREAEVMTGLQAGGISPLVLLHKGFQVVLDASAQVQTEMHVSGGQRGLNIRLPVEAFIRLTKAWIGQVSSTDDA